MSTAAKDISRDEELLLIVERDIPALKDEVSEIKENQSAVEEKIDGCRTDIAAVGGKVDLLTIEIKAIRDIGSLPWYRDFQKVLILMLVAGLLVLAGVKGAESLFDIPAKAVGVDTTSGG